MSWLSSCVGNTFAARTVSPGQVVEISYPSLCHEAGVRSESVGPAYFIVLLLLLLLRLVLSIECMGFLIPFPHPHEPRCDLVFLVTFDL